MSFKCKVILLCCICSTYKVASKVVLVKRNVTDSFRVGKDGCANNASVCTSSATCQSDTGLCLCNEDLPNYVNSIEKCSNGQYCCVSNNMIPYLVGGNRVCEFGPFQVMPHRHNAPATQFRYSNDSVKFKFCRLAKSTKPKVKFPDYSREREIEWLNGSYVNFTMSGNMLFFKWKRSVPNLQGTIIKLKMYCKTFGTHFLQPCLQAKVLGTWFADSVIVTTQPSNKLTTHEVTLNNKITPTLLAISRPPREVPGRNGDFNWTPFVVAVVVSLAIVMVLVFVVCFLFKRWKKNYQTNSHRESVEARSGLTSMQEIRDTGGNGEGMDLSEDLPSTVIAERNPTYSAPIFQSVVVVVTPGHESIVVVKERGETKMKGSDVENGKADSANLYDEPGYASPYVQKDEVECTGSKSPYAKPNNKSEADNVKGKGRINPNSLEEFGYEIPDLKMEGTKGFSADATYAKPDKKRSEGNIKSGQSTVSDSYEKPGYEILKKEDADGTTSDTTYAKPDKKKKEVERQNHPGSDNSTKNEKEIAVHTSPDIKRIEINGDLYAIPDKSKDSKKNESSDKEESTDRF